MRLELRLGDAARYDEMRRDAARHPPLPLHVALLLHHMGRYSYEGLAIEKTIVEEVALRGEDGVTPMDVHVPNSPK